MKYIILVIGYLIIRFLNTENLKDHGGYGGGIGMFIPMMLWLAWTVIWLIVFFAIGFDIPLSIKWVG